MFFNVSSRRGNKRLMKTHLKDLTGPFIFKAWYFLMRKRTMNNHNLFLHNNKLLWWACITFLRSYTERLSALEVTYVGQSVISQRIWQQAAEQRRKTSSVPWQHGACSDGKLLASIKTCEGIINTIA